MPLGQRIAHMRPEGRLGVLDPLEEAIFDSCLPARCCCLGGASEPPAVVRADYHALSAVVTGCLGHTRLAGTLVRWSY